MSARKQRERAAAKRGRECTACHRVRAWWEFSTTSHVCIDCQVATGERGLNNLPTYGTKKEEQV